MKVEKIAAFIIEKDDKVLVEKRKLNTHVDPGKVVIPGGHVDPGETHEQTCTRELKEELDLDCHEWSFVIELPHAAVGENELIRFYAARHWFGTIKVMEADTVFWIGPDELDKLDYEVDKKAVRTFFEKGGK